MPVRITEDPVAADRLDGMGDPGAERGIVLRTVAFSAN